MPPGPGPVFVYEWLATTRRWQLYALRAGFVGLLLAGMILAWRSNRAGMVGGASVSLQTLATYGQQLFLTTVMIELSLVLLAAPAATAGAVCLDKARGTLDHMLATDLSNAEIVLGKLLVRLIPVLGLIACVLPLSALTSLLGGIDPTALLGSFLTTIACAILGCSLAMALSVWGRKTHEVLMVTYLILLAWLGSPLLIMMLFQAFGSGLPASLPQSILAWVEITNPFYLVYAPYQLPGTVSIATFLAFASVCLLISALFVALASWRIRAVALKQVGRGSVSSQRRWARGLGFTRPRWLPRLPGPTLDGNPVLWREWQRFRPSRFVRVAWFLYTGVGVIFTFVAMAPFSSAGNRTEEISIMTMVQVGIGLLLLSVSASTSLAEERARASLDILLCTPLSTFSILVGKWWGAFRLAPHVIFWPALLAGILVFDHGSWLCYFLLLALVLAYCAAIASVGLALATWISRLGRAVAVCTSVYVGFSFGWMFLIMSLFPPKFAGVLLIMGSPLFGTATAASLVGAAPNNVVGQNTGAATAGAILWILLHGGAAAFLFLATWATFDHCLGRVSSTSRAPRRRPGKEPWPARKPVLDDWLDDDQLELAESPQA